MAEVIVELPREALSLSEVANVSGLGRTLIYKAIANGSLIAHKAGRRTIVLRNDLKAFLAELPQWPVTR
jgi:excisionase family DNA binding protein